MSREPGLLSRGKRFHQEVQACFETDPGDGEARRERFTFLPTPPGARWQRRGRIDLLLDEGEGYVVAIEIKNTYWDRIKPANVRRNLLSHARQLQDYIDWLYESPGYEVTGAIIYPEPPSSQGLRERVETFWDDLAIMVVWYSEARAVAGGSATE
jgi:hypothetical protein